jgi:hypothetical protein
MNERLKELKQQAGIDFNPDQEGLDLFAELIVQECLNICEDMGDNGKDGHYCADKITKTFLR